MQTYTAFLSVVVVLVFRVVDGVVVVEGGFVVVVEGGFVVVVEGGFVVVVDDGFVVVLDFVVVVVVVDVRLPKRWRSRFVTVITVGYFAEQNAAAFGSPANGESSPYTPDEHTEPVAKHTVASAATRERKNSTRIVEKHSSRRR